MCRWSMAWLRTLCSTPAHTLGVIRSRFQRRPRRPPAKFLPPEWPIENEIISDRRWQIRLCFLFSSMEKRDGYLDRRKTESVYIILYINALPQIMHIPFFCLAVSLLNWSSRFYSQLDWGHGCSAATNLAWWMHGGWFHAALAHGTHVTTFVVYDMRSLQSTWKICLSWYLACWILGLRPAFLADGQLLRRSHFSVYEHFCVLYYAFGRCFVFFSGYPVMCRVLPLSSPVFPLSEKNQPVTCMNRIL